MAKKPLASNDSPRHVKHQQHHIEARSRAMASLTKQVGDKAPPEEYKTLSRTWRHVHRGEI